MFPPPLGPTSPGWILEAAAREAIAFALLVDCMQGLFEHASTVLACT